MGEEKLNLFLYILYLLEITHIEDEKLENDIISNIQIMLLKSTNVKFKTKKDLSNLLKIKLNDLLNYQDLENEKTINFKIGDVIKTSKSTSFIKLKFIIINEKGIKQITIFENDIKLKTLSI